MRLRPSALPSASTCTIPSPSPLFVSALRRSTCQLCSHNGIEQPATHIDMINLTRLCIDCSKAGSSDYSYGRSKFSMVLLQHRMKSLYRLYDRVRATSGGEDSGNKEGDTEARLRFDLGEQPGFRRYVRCVEVGSLDGNGEAMVK
jgi:hypothetical protein